MKTNYKTVLAGVDGSDQSYEAVRKAAEIVRDSDGKLLLATVVDVRSLQSREALRFEYTSEVTDSVKERLNKVSDRLKRDYDLDNVETIVAYGSPAEQMSDTLPNDYDVDLIVVGATGKTAAERVLIGSVAQRVTSIAPCDVLVVRD